MLARYFSDRTQQALVYGTEIRRDVVVSNINAKTTFPRSPHRAHAARNQRVVARSRPTTDPPTTIRHDRLAYLQ
jgi:hypothetical protein